MTPKIPIPVSSREEMNLLVGEAGGLARQSGEDFAAEMTALKVLVWGSQNFGTVLLAALETSEYTGDPTFAFYMAFSVGFRAGVLACHPELVGANGRFDPEPDMPDETKGGS